MPDLGVVLDPQAPPARTAARGAGERVFGLDLLRAVAILLVLLGHARFFLRAAFPGAQSLSVGGFLGVELFFVLSGFLIGGIILRSFGEAPTGRTLRTFWIRRWFRTLPNYYLFLLLNLLLPHTESLRELAGYTLFLQNLAWRAPVFFNESWSLAIEEWFYLLFPVLLVLASRVWRRPRVALAVALSLLLVGSLAARVAVVASGPADWDADVRKVVLLRLDALMLGVLGAFLKSSQPGRWERARRPGAVLGVLLLAASAGLYFLLHRNQSFFARTFYFSLTSLSPFCLLPALDAWRSARGALARGVESVSLWSYSLYLCQLPVGTLLIGAFGDPDLTRPGAAACLALGGAFIAASTALSGVVYRFFERPAMGLRERF